VYDFLGDLARKKECSRSDCDCVVVVSAIEQGSLTRHAPKAAAFTCDDTKRASRLGARNGCGRTSLQLERPLPRSLHMSTVSALRRTMATSSTESRKVVEGIFGK
jgi:hypothetical protein